MKKRCNMKRMYSILLALALVVTGMPGIGAKAATVPIGGTVEDRTYTWNFSDVTGEDGGSTLDYSDNCAAIRVALGSINDTLSAEGIAFANPSCKENDTLGFENAAVTNRYVLIKPVYSGTVNLTVCFEEVYKSAKGRIWVNDFGTVSFDAVDVTNLTKGTGTQLGSDFGASLSTAGSQTQELSFEVEAGHVYSLHTYNKKSTITALSYEMDDYTQGTVTDGNTDGEGETITPGTGLEGTVSGSGELKKSFDFEGDLTEWTIEGSVALSTAEAKEGSQSLLVKKSSDATGSASATITGIDQGSYTVTMWVKGAASGSRLTISETGGPDSVVKIDNATSDSSDWVQIAHTNVLVYNGQMTINITDKSTAGIYVDKIEVALDSNDNNPVSNWDFEDGLEGWETTEGAMLITEGADTGEGAVRLADQAEISQIISVKPDTDYIATVRMRVDEQDTYTSTDQYSLDGEELLGIFVERETLGNRVNVGVRGLDGVVLRQAPAGTEGYALVTIAFHTGNNQTQVELYANTIYDENYVDSVTVYENVDEGNPYPNGWQRPDSSETDNIHPADDWTSNGGQYAYVDNFDVFEVNNDYIKGADMAFLQPIEDCGGKYFANGVQQDALRILSNHGVNSILSMVFVHGGNEVYNWTDLQKMPTSNLGYDGEEVTGRQVVEGYFDREHIKALALRSQELGMTFSMGFQYSDTWISAVKAHMPYEWFEQDYEGKLSNPDIYMLETAVYNYVHDFLTDLKVAGVNNVISIKHGNEQDGGLLFPVAMGSAYEAHAAIITASSKAAHEIYPGAINTIHTNTGYTTTQLSNFFLRLINKGAEVDGMAYSLYGGRDTASQHAMMKEAMADDTLKYYDYINVETGFSYTKEGRVGKESAMGLTQYYDISPAGQYNYLLNYMQAPMNVPNPYGVMRGFYYWNTDAIAVYGAGHKQGEAAGGTVRALFNNGTESIQEPGSAEPGKMGDMTEGVYAYLFRGTAKSVSDEIYTPLKTEGVNYELGEAEAITIENDEISLEVGERARIKNRVSNTGEILGDYSVSYSSSDTDVAVVSEYGFVSAVGAGTATITANIGDVSATATVTVTEAVKATDMTIQYTVMRGKETIFTSTVEENGTIEVTPFDKVKFNTTLSGDPTSTEVVYTLDNATSAKWYGDTWQTSDTEMRTIVTPLSTNNYMPIVQLNALEDGAVNVTAKAANNGPEVNFAVEVAKVPVESISINEGDSEVKQGRSLQLSATVSPEDATYYKVNWTSADESIAKVDENGLVIGVTSGTTTITITSDDDATITDSIQLTVKEITVEELILSRSTLAMMVGGSKQLFVSISPDNAANKTVTWSISSGDEGIVSVDENGVVTGLAEGQGTVMVTTNDGSNLSAECVVTVQTEPISAAGMEIDQSEVWVKSNYFSQEKGVRGETAPMVKLDVVFEPLDTTNTDVTWISDNEEVANVDANGIVTAKKTGVAHITAVSEDGGFTDTATVYVPYISEDWENYDENETGGFTDGNTFTYQVIGTEDGNKLQASVNSQKGSATSLNRHSITPLTGDKVVVDFDWNVGHFTACNRSRGANLSIEDANGNTYLALSAFPPVDGTQYAMTYYCKDGSTAFPSSGSNFNYIHGGGGAGGSYSDCVEIDESLLTGADQVYSVHVELDFEARTISFTVTDKEDPTVTTTVSDLPMDINVDYSDSVGAICFSHYFNSAASWTTSLDNLALYTTTGIMAEGIDYTVDCVNMNTVSGIKLVPIAGALSSTAKINASVVPATADQSIIYTVSDELADVIEVSADGTITIKEDKLVDYNNQAAIGQTNGTIRISAAQNVAVYEDINVSVGPANTNEKIFIYADGEECGEDVLERMVNKPVSLTYIASGGDGTSDVYSYGWEVVSGEDAVIDENGVLTANSVGEVTVKFTLDLFRGENEVLIKFNFTEEAVEPIPTATPISTATPTPTTTPAPTATPGATATPIPTAIPVSTNTPAPVTEEKQNGVTYEIDGNGVAVTEIDQTEAKVVIPDTIAIDGKEYKVTSLPKNAFKNNKKLTSITIGNNVTSIGDYAFYGCTNLKTVKIGKNVVTIGKCAFAKNTSLTSITIPDKVKTIGANAFDGCTKLKNVKLGKSLNTISDKMFYKCKALTKVTIPAKVTKIGKSAFANCTKLSSVTIGKKVSTIGASAFYKCTALKKVTIPSGVKSIDGSAFSGCTKLATVTIGIKVQTIDKNAFQKCTALKKVTIPASVKTIGANAFNGCKNLKSISIKTTKLTGKTVGNKAFSGINAKATIKVPSGKLADYRKLLVSKGVKKTVIIKK